MAGFMEWFRGEVGFDAVAPKAADWAKERNRWSSFVESPVKLNLYVRSNIAWKYASMDDLTERTAAARPDVMASIKWWNANIATSYLDYRAAMQDLSERSWRNIRQLDAVIKQDMRYVQALTAIAGDDLPMVFLPTDDDDWFAPAISDMLAATYEANPDTDVISWNVGRVDHRTGISFGSESRRQFQTNGYAITDKGLQKLAAIDENLPMLAMRRHTAMKRVVQEFDSRFIVADVEDRYCYAIKNASPASVTNMVKLSGNDGARDEVRRSYAGLKEDIPEPMAWATDHIMAMRALPL